MKINWKVRFKNPIFIAQIILAALTPLLAYVGLSFTDLTTWRTLWDLIVQAYSNPYLLSLIVVSVFNTVTDPTTKNFGDSKQALRYEYPRDDSKFIE